MVDAVYAFALALHNLYEDLCKNYKKLGVCPAMTQYDGGEFYKKYLLNVSFAGKLVKLIKNFSIVCKRNHLGFL